MLTPEDGQLTVSLSDVCNCSISPRAIFGGGREAVAAAVPFGDAVRSLSMPSRKQNLLGGASDPYPTSLIPPRCPLRMSVRALNSTIAIRRDGAAAAVPFGDAALMQPP
jgi:hypothetical protein